MIRKTLPRCPYVNHQKCSVHCADFALSPETCETCGWNPVEHERRVKLLRSGEVKSFLKVDIKALQKKYGPLEEDGEDDV